MTTLLMAVSYVATFVAAFVAGRWFTTRETDVQLNVARIRAEGAERHADRVAEERRELAATLTEQQAVTLKWQTQATVLASQNDRLLNELAEARVDATASTRDILAAFTGPPPATDGPQPDSPPSPQTQLDEALADAFSLEDWTDNITDPLGAPPTTPPPFLADIPAVEDHDA